MVHLSFCTHDSWFIIIFQRLNQYITEIKLNLYNFHSLLSRIRQLNNFHTQTKLCAESIKLTMISNRISNIDLNSFKRAAQRLEYLHYLFLSVDYLMHINRDKNPLECKLRYLLKYK